MATARAGDTLIALLLVLGSLYACGNVAEQRQADATASPTTVPGDTTPTSIPDDQVTPPIATLAPTLVPTPSPSAVPTFAVVPTVPPVPTEFGEVTFDQPTELPAISEEEAIAIARQSPGSMVDLSVVPREQFTAIYVLWTDPRIDLTNVLGTPVARDEPVWIVTVHGLELPEHPIPGQTPTALPVNHEWNIVIDAMTGRWVTSFTFK